MKIAHVALWTNELEVLKDFYCKYFDGVSGEKYTNQLKGFSSYFITFESGSRLEIMTGKGLVEGEDTEMATVVGLAHLAMAVGNEFALRSLTERFKKDGYTVLSDIRRTGDGYLESIVLDPDGNVIELTV